MSAPAEPSPPGSRRPDSGRGGCLPALLGLIGIVLLLPGICSLLFMVSSWFGGETLRGLGGLWVITFFIAAGGIALISYALRHSARPGDPHERP